MRSTVGLKSKPKAVPLSAGENEPEPSAVAVALVRCTVYSRPMFVTAISWRPAGRTSMPPMRSPSARPVSGLERVHFDGARSSKVYRRLAESTATKLSADAAGA